MVTVYGSIHLGVKVEKRRCGEGVNEELLLLQHYGAFDDFETFLFI